MSHGGFAGLSGLPKRAHTGTPESANPPPVSDCVFQQLAPVNTWGKEFFAPVSHIASNRVRIVVSKNGTDIEQIGGIIQSVGGSQPSLINLQAGQFVELEVPVSSNGCYITANNPVGVCTFLDGAGAGHSGDAAMSWLPPKEQSVKSALIAPFIPNPPTNIHFHYANLTTPTVTKNNTQVSVGGEYPTDLVGGSWIDNVDAGMSFYKMPLNKDTAAYCFTNHAGFLILCYGVGSNEAYYYPAYSAMRDLDAAFYANNIHFQDLKDNSFCESLVEFRAQIDGNGIEIDTVKWYINGNEEITERNKLDWNKPFSVGNYEIKMWVHFENNDTISKTGMLIIKNCSMETAFFANNVLHSSLQDTTFCNKSVNFRAEIEEVFSNWDSIKWYVDYGSGEVEETSATNQTTWSKDFANGTYPVKMWVLFVNGEEATITGTLKIQALWIKMRNIRY
jgi:hypothetical protein